MPMKYNQFVKAIDSARIPSPLVTVLELANHRLANLGGWNSVMPLTELSALIASGLADNSVTNAYGIGQPLVGQSPKLSECDRPRSQQRPHA
jgi:hypothetical protein